ncbi:hypothetical protein V5O48_005434 [Marasmius crinis-equi]|uniref:Uncharacterized protein n=1 Tax=Marasmius crinis-equi TaxID=585013 RepID=A0ABR3FMG5_9AGAR
MSQLYNITLSSQTASIKYRPYRDGDMASGWNVTYSYGTRDTGYGKPQGIGVDYHQTTLDGASLELNWTGTAVYLYGNGSSDCFNITVDDQVEKTFDAPHGGLLGEITGLHAGSHTVRLTARGGKKIAFQYAQVTIDLGSSGSHGVSNWTAYAVNGTADNDSLTSNTPFFNFSGRRNGWKVQDLTLGNTTPVEDRPQIFRPNGTITTLHHQMVTSDAEDCLSFEVSNASAFILWGTVDSNHGSKQVLFSGPGITTKETVLEDNSSALDFWQILYWESGLDRDNTYTVDVLNKGDRSGFAFSEIKFINGGSGSKALNSGLIAAIDIAGVGLVTLLAVAGLIYWRRRTKAKHPVWFHRTSLTDLEPIEFASPDVASKRTTITGDSLTSYTGVMPATPDTARRQTKVVFVEK